MKKDITQTVRVRDAVMGFAWIFITIVSARIFLEVFRAFVDFDLHYPVLYTVNVQRFLYLEVCLFLGGVAFGMFSIYFYVRIQQICAAKKEKAVKK